MHRYDGSRFVVRADNKSTAFAELESAIRQLRFFEIANVFMRFDHVARTVIDTNHCVLRTGVTHVLGLRIFTITVAKAARKTVDHSFFA